MTGVCLPIMAVSALPRARARASSLATLSPGALVLTLVAPALDLLARVQPGAALPMLALVASAGAAAILLMTWLRFPRTGWLAAASLAACACTAMRLVGAEVAPLLGLLAVFAVGIGGGFGSPTRDAEAWLG
jgi:hypothetical protein